MEGEQPDVFDRSLVKARKKHTCYECGYVVSPGTKYWVSAGLWAGVWQRFKTCVCCEDLRAKLDDNDWGQAPFGDLIEWAYEYVKDGGV